MVSEKVIVRYTKGGMIVLILVVVEDGLGGCFHNRCGNFDAVLILVVVEDGLGGIYSSI